MINKKDYVDGKFLKGWKTLSSSLFLFLLLAVHTYMHVGVISITGVLRKTACGVCSGHSSHDVQDALRVICRTYTTSITMYAKATEAFVLIVVVGIL